MLFIFTLRIMRTNWRQSWLQDIFWYYRETLYALIHVHTHALSSKAKWFSIGIIIQKITHTYDIRSQTQTHTHTHTLTHEKVESTGPIYYKNGSRVYVIFNNTTLLLCLAEVDGIKDIRVEKKNNLYSGDFKILKTFKVDPG